MANELKDIINRLERQKAAIERALSALREVDDTKIEEAATPRKRRAQKGARKRAISDEGRQRIAEAQRKRWAAKKRATKRTQRAGTKKT